MSGTGTKVVRNASVLMTSQLITWTLSLLLTVFLPRYLGATAVGEFVLANSIWIVMGLLINFGLDTFLTKEIARQPSRTAELIGMTLLLRVVLFALSCLIVAIYLRVMTYPPTVKYIVWIIGFASLVAQLSSAFQASLQGLESMHYTSIAGVTSKAVYTGLGIAVVLLGYSIYTVAFVNMISALVGFTLLLIFLGRRHKPRLILQATPPLHMIKSGFPYMMSGLGLILYGQVDVLIISSLVDTKELGWYGAASQLFGTLLFIPVVFTTAIFPVLTRTYNNTPDALPRMLRKTFDLMLLTSIPIGLGLFVVAEQVVRLLFGPGFAQSGPILAFMGIVLIFTYQNVLIGQFLISTDRQNYWTAVMLVATAITIPLDLVLVPWCQQVFGNGAIAGALSFIVTEFLMAAVGIWLLPKGSLGWSNVRSGVLITIAGLVMFAAAWWVRDSFIVIPIVVGAITYSVLIVILRVVPQEDINLFKGMAQAILRKLRRQETEPVGITGV